MAFWLNSFYIVVLAWAMYYMYSSFAWDVPWRSCGNPWNTAVCRTNEDIRNSVNYCKRLLDDPGSVMDGQNPFPSSEPPQCPFNASVLRSPVEEFWRYNVLSQTSGLDEPGELRVPLAITLGITWIVCYFCIWRGVKWTGKVVYFTSMFPYVLLVILLIRGISLPGAFIGIRYYLKPDLSKLSDSTVWIDAATQIFFSYGLGLGALIALGSYNKYNNNVQK